MTATEIETEQRLRERAETAEREQMRLSRENDALKAKVEKLTAQFAEAAGLAADLSLARSHDMQRYLPVEAAVARVREVCDAAEHQATRWAQPFPVPDWVVDVRAALDGAE